MQAPNNLPDISLTDATLRILSRPDFPRILDAAIDHALTRTVDRILAKYEQKEQGDN